MTKPTLLPGGCAHKHGVDTIFFQVRWPYVLGMLVAVFCAALSARAADVSVYSVTKGMQYVQNTDGPPVFLPLNEYLFQANVFSVESNVIRSAMVEATNNIDRVLEKQDPTEFEFDDLENDPRDLRAKYPNGRYRFRIRTLNDGWRTNLTLVLTGKYPTVPHILNHTALQSASGSGYVEVQWAPFIGGTAADSIQLRIETLTGTRAFETRDFGEPGALDGRATNVVIEPGSLLPDTAYIAWLEFRRTSHIETNRYPGALGWAYLHRRTEFRIRTSDATAPDAAAYEVSKGRFYVQTNALTPVPDGTNAFQFVAEVQGQDSNSIDTATLTVPGGNVLSLSAAGTEHTFVAQSETPIDTVYPEGVYTFNLVTEGNDPRSLPLNLSPASYPPPPHINNFDPSQPIVYGSPLLLQWDAWPDGGPADFIQLQVRNGGTNAFETGDFGDNDALNGFATGVLVPAEVFVEGEDYTVRLTFRRFTDLTTAQYPGALGTASYFSRTELEIAPLQDVEQYEVAKGQHYIQTNNVGPIPDGTNAYRFTAELQAQSSNTVTSVSLDLPAGAGTIPLTNNAGEFAFTESSASPLDSLYPDGTYVFSATTTHQGQPTLPLDLSGGGYPPPPRFLHDPAQRFAEDQPIVLGWERWGDGTLNDFVQLQIRDSGTNVFETPDFGEPGALNGLATNAVIPAGLLARAERYTARLVFQRMVDTDSNSFPGALGRAYFYSRTDSDLRTVEPDVEDYEIEKGRNFVQTSATEIVPEPGEEFVFSAQVQGSSTGLISSAILFIPSGIVSNLTASDTTLEQFEMSDVASSNELFEAAYPSGTYRFEVVTQNDGTQSLLLQVTNATYPPIPQILDFRFNTNSPIQAGPPVLLEWAPWPDGTTNDFVQVQIRDSGTNVFETPNFGDIGALNGLSTNAVVPAGMLLPGKNYGARVIFRRFVFNEETAPGTAGTVSFFTRTKFDISTFDPDIASYSLFKGAEYIQTNSGAPMAMEFVLDAVITAGMDEEFQVSTLAGATLTPPGRDPVPLTPGDDDNLLWVLRQSFATRQELDDAFPDGPYLISIEGARYGATNFTVYLTNDIPNPPHIVNYDAAGRIVASQPFLLEWDPFIGGTNTDYISSQFLNSAGTPVYSTAPPGDAAALNGLRTTTSLNGATLFGNAIYDASVRFEKVLLSDLTTFVEVPGRVGYYARTSFRALTTGAGNPPRFSARLFELVPPNHAKFVVGVIPGGSYIFEGSTNLVDWAVITNLSATTDFYTNTVARPGPEFFIRGSLLR